VELGEELADLKVYKRLVFGIQEALGFGFAESDDIGRGEGGWGR
jgi:hypothetical protein